MGLVSFPQPAAYLWPVASAAGSFDIFHLVLLPIQVSDRPCTWFLARYFGENSGPGDHAANQRAICCGNNLLATGARAPASWRGVVANTMMPNQDVCLIVTLARVSQSVSPSVSLFAQFMALVFVNVLSRSLSLSPFPPLLDRSILTPSISRDMTPWYRTSQPAPSSRWGGHWHSLAAKASAKYEPLFNVYTRYLNWTC